jgi:methyltransferase (TIGR00027 family)
MQTGLPSRTALSAAAHRAAHQVLEDGGIFADPLAPRILGRGAEEIARDAAARPERLAMRLFIAVRTRFAEDHLAAAVARGVRQLAVLGAGLDTFAYRNPHEAAGLKVFEVDHPATQGWKRERLFEAGITPPPSLTFAPVDFERAALADGLAAAGFDPERPTFFTWLGVVPYLTREAVFATLGFIAALAGGAEVAFDYSDPPTALAPEQQAGQKLRAERVAALGEPWLSYFSRETLAADLSRLGFRGIEDLGPSEIRARYFGALATAPKFGGHVIWARTKG